MGGRLITDNHHGFDMIEDDWQTIYTPHLPYPETARIYDFFFSALSHSPMCAQAQFERLE